MRNYGIAVALFLFGLVSPAYGSSQEKPLSIATFAGGCFWCMEHPFDELAGVQQTISGYTGGHKADPSYEEVSSGNTGHAEAVQVYFNVGIISYEELLQVFWRNIDPTVRDRQFVDVGSQYRAEIFYHDEQQRVKALKSRTDLEQSAVFDKAIVTEITPFSIFYPAEDYHQDYYLKNPIRYKFYRYGSGRDRFLDRFWGTHRKD